MQLKTIIEIEKRRELKLELFPNGLTKISSLKTIMTWLYNYRIRPLISPIILCGDLVTHG
jgi:hypothetical protein